MKRNTENIFLSIFLISQAMLFGAMIIFAITLTKQVSESSKDMLNQHALKVSEENMKERVENIVSLLEQERKSVLDGVESLGITIYQNMYQQDETKLDKFLESWAPRIGQMQYGDLIYMVSYDKQTSRYTVYYEGKVEKIPADVYSYKVMDYINSAPYCRQVDYRYKTLYIIASQERIDKEAQKRIYKTIHAAKYGQNGYVWVNEVVNYEGGDDYAIRRIHPILQVGEGQLLSTNVQDAKGNHYLLEELNEVKEHGETLYIYYYKNMKEGTLGEKASYAKLYEPFNWIIATSTPLYDVLVYSETLNKENQEALTKTLTYTIVILLLIFVGDVWLILFNDKKMKERITLEETIANAEEELKQADYESMTGVLRRGAGEYKVREYLDNSDNKKGILIIVDLDDLKKINDTLGHRAGDEAIVGIANSLKSSFRSSDIIMRYGGDEFVVFVPEEGNNLDPVMNRMGMLVKKVASVFIGENKERNIHCSIGYATVIEGDTFETLFSRADKALYHVKKNGKNSFACYSPEMEKEG